MNLERVVFGFFVILTLSLNVAFVAGSVETVSHHNVWILTFTIIVNLVAIGLKLGDRSQTGALLLASGPDNPVTLTFLGETHFVVLRRADICAGFEDMWARWRETGLDPRTVNLVTGPSRSADIGQTLQLGAHGPVALHVFLLGE